MNILTSIRPLLLSAAAFNFGAALAFALPGSVGKLAALPVAVPLLYAVLVALFVALFGGCYAWLAMQPVIPRPMVAFGAIGKSCAFLAFTGLWLLGEASGLLALASVGDLLFAGLFVHWLRRSAGTASA